MNTESGENTPKIKGPIRIELDLLNEYTAQILQELYDLEQEFSSILIHNELVPESTQSDFKEEQQVQSVLSMEVKQTNKELLSILNKILDIKHRNTL
jgi:hypothetical protein